MYTPTKYDLRILSYINRHRNGVTRAKLLKHFKRNPERVDLLCNLQYISNNYESERDNDGFVIGSIPDSAIYHIKDTGVIEVEAHQWFDFRFVLLQIVLPIVIAIITTLITIFLTALLQPFR